MERSRSSYGLEDGTTLIAYIVPPLSEQEHWQLHETTAPPWTEWGLRSGIEVLIRSWGKSVSFELLRD